MMPKYKIVNLQLPVHKLAQITEPLTESIQSCPCHNKKLVFVIVIMIKKGIVFEKLWQTGEVPSGWKKGNITPYF